MNHIERAYKNAKEVNINEFSRIVVISDCHRGYGGWADNFLGNENSYLAALRYYARNGYTYIELGDGDELWENRRFSEITAAHSEVFTLLRRLWIDGRFMMLYGNHDVEKKLRPEMLSSYYNIPATCACALFPGITPLESVLLKYGEAGEEEREILLLHGHQGDFFNDQLWRLSRFLVRYFWGPLQAVGIKAPGTAKVNNKSKIKTEKNLMDWAQEHQITMIAGHTHRPCFPENPGEPPYYNDGCCTHPNQISAIELIGGEIKLVSWKNKTRPDGTLFVGREVIAGPQKL
ncbi:MAG: metallophosphoesterase [Oscillospiraceae bacterium]|jgi:UDP-2,3-diacylglucosamine pyrophosphatase LpxH|nr:metallophosphoesterase [Oscillospiraceae bacterium]